MNRDVECLRSEQCTNDEWRTGVRNLVFPFDFQSRDWGQICLGHVRKCSKCRRHIVPVRQAFGEAVRPTVFSYLVESLVLIDDGSIAAILSGFALGMNADWNACV